jgi:hypothetical protein
VIPTKLTVNELIRHYLTKRSIQPSARGRILRTLATCRTEARGGHVLACDECRAEQYVWNPCNNRHCPSCLFGEAKDWVARQQRDLLPVRYFHVVFTLPRLLADLALYNKEKLYALLMKTSAEVLKTIGDDPKHLGGELGFLSVLHTWSQRLEHHPHVHSIVPGGALTRDGQRWIHCKDGFFLPVRVLSALFRRRFLEELERFRNNGELRFRGTVAHLAPRQAWDAAIAELKRQAWTVYAKRPFGGPQQVLEYLARYTHRVAISNRRLVAFDGENVTFTFRKSSEPYERDTITLPLEQFIDRFCLHILPKGFTRIRSYGFLASGVRSARLPRIRELLDAEPPNTTHTEDIEAPESAKDCPVCGKGKLHKQREIRPLLRLRSRSKKSPNATTGPPAPPRIRGVTSADGRRAA